MRIRARCRTLSGLRDQGEIQDISEHGCRITMPSLNAAVGCHVIVTPEHMEGIAGIVRWRAQGVAGVEFDHPLYGPIVEHLGRLHPAVATIAVAEAFRS